MYIIYVNSHFNIHNFTFFDFIVTVCHSHDDIGCPVRQRSKRTAFSLGKFSCAYAYACFTCVMLIAQV